MMAARSVSVCAIKNAVRAYCLRSIDVTITDSTNNGLLSMLNFLTIFFAGVTYQLWKGQRPLKCKRACLVEEAAKQLLLVPPGLGLVLSGDGCLRVHAGWK